MRLKDRALESSYPPSAGGEKEVGTSLAAPGRFAEGSHNY
jgi:hypothetical protein